MQTAPLGRKKGELLKIRPQLIYHEKYSPPPNFSTVPICGAMQYACHIKSEYIPKVLKHCSDGNTVCGQFMKIIKKKP